jgi:hypothetical protein
VQVLEHPLTANVEDWSTLLGGEALKPPEGAGWRRLVWSGGGADTPARVLLAVREEPVKQVWAAYNDRFAASVSFVVFWTNTFNWLGGGGGSFAGAMPRRLGSEWRMLDGADAPTGVVAGYWPGVYRRGPADTLAVNAGRVVIEKASAADWRGDLARVSVEYAPRLRGFPLGAMLLIAAIGAMGVAAATWKAGAQRRHVPLAIEHPSEPKTRDASSRAS